MLSATAPMVANSNPLKAHWKNCISIVYSNGPGTPFPAWMSLGMIAITMILRFFPSRLLTE